MAERRVRPGDGRPLAPFRWWQTLSRSLFLLTLPASATSPTRYAIDVRTLGDREDGEIRARLYRDGALQAVSRLPARFPVPGGHIEVAARASGLRRCHFVSSSGQERALTPHPRSGEGLRARLDRTHPRVSRAIGVASAVIVTIGACLTVPQVIEAVSRIPLIADSLGTFVSPLHLPPAMNAAITVAVVIASGERALRLRSSWLDELAT